MEQRTHVKISTSWLVASAMPQIGMFEVIDPFLQEQVAWSYLKGMDMPHDATKVTVDENPTSNHFDRYVTLENLNPFHQLSQHINEAFKSNQLRDIYSKSYVFPGNVPQNQPLAQKKSSLYTATQLFLNDLPCHGPLDVVDPTLNPQTSGANPTMPAVILLMEDIRLTTWDTVYKPKQLWYFHYQLVEKNLPSTEWWGL